ncbi:MAG: hypothetical protein JKP98_19125 [Rhodobacteraceae bacterium]|nr:hypothetical protein [Paracoccaceae bacterium]
MQEIAVVVGEDVLTARDAEKTACCAEQVIVAVADLRRAADAELQIGLGPGGPTARQAPGNRAELVEKLRLAEPRVDVGIDTGAGVQDEGKLASIVLVDDRKAQLFLGRAGGGSGDISSETTTPSAPRAPS